METIFPRENIHYNLFILEVEFESIDDERECNKHIFQDDMTVHA